MRTNTYMLTESEMSHIRGATLMLIVQDRMTPQAAFLRALSLHIEVLGVSAGTDAKRWLEAELPGGTTITVEQEEGRNYKVEYHVP